MSGWAGEIEEQKSPAILGRTDIENPHRRRATSSAQLLQQSGQLKQVGDPEVGPPGGYDQGGIGGGQTGPLRRERSQLLPVVFEVDPVLSPVLSPCDHGELVSGVRMERMGDPETFYRTVLIDCSWRCT